MRLCHACFIMPHGVMKAADPGLGVSDVDMSAEDAHEPIRVRVGALCPPLVCRSLCTHVRGISRCVLQVIREFKEVAHFEASIRVDPSKRDKATTRSKSPDRKETENAVREHELR